MKYLSMELFNDVASDCYLPDLTKSDIFALGISLYSLMICNIFFMSQFNLIIL